MLDGASATRRRCSRFYPFSSVNVNFQSAVALLEGLQRQRRSGLDSSARWLNVYFVLFLFPSVAQNFPSSAATSRRQREVGKEEVQVLSVHFFRAGHSRGKDSETFHWHAVGRQLRPDLGRLARISLSLDQSGEAEMGWAASAPVQHGCAFPVWTCGGAQSQARVIGGGGEGTLYKDLMRSFCHWWHKCFLCFVSLLRIPCLSLEFRLCLDGLLSVWEKELSQHYVTITQTNNLQCWLARLKVRRTRSVENPCDDWVTVLSDVWIA